ncbi:MAG TPA: ROK family transcriptional regulator [Anaerolineales bacterium]|nr:ROK family transcriptional regulator [Anaerolineales bacterium]
MDLIRFAGRGLSRTDLAEEMGLTKAAVTVIVNDLIASGIIVETESRTTSSGRPPVVLEINPNHGLVAAIDMGAMHLSVALGDFSTRILEEIEIPFQIADGPEKCLKEADRILHELLSKRGLIPSDLSGIGVGVPGPVITELGTVMAPPIMPGWDRYPIRATFEEQWETAITLNNDAELGALGEWAFGAGRGERNLAFIKVGSGIGAGLIVNRQIYSGTTGSAGEIGHLTVDENGPLCACGNHGCLEAFAGGHAIATQARKLVASGKRTLLSEKDIGTLTAQDVAEAARRGDLPAQEVLKRSGTYIGTAIAGLINLINPSTVIIGGGVAQVGDLLTTPIRQAVRERSLRASEHGVKITTAMLGRRSSLIGALVQAINIATHESIERRTQSNRQQTLEIDRADEFNIVKEVVVNKD